jgi:hypothetical protein
MTTTIVTARAGTPSLEDFLGFVRLNNLARQERFFAGIAPPGTLLGTSYSGSNAQVLNLLCEQAAIPGKTINARTLRINGINEYRAGTIDYGGDGITLQFLVDGNYRVREIMENWMEMCVNSSDSARNEVEFYNTYIGTITLNALMPAGIPGEALLNWSPTQADIGLNSALDTLRTKNRALGILGTKISQGVGRKINDVVAKTKASITKNIPASVLEAFRDTENTVYSVNLHECWPRSMNIMPLGYDAVGVARLSVTFAYRHWTSSVKSADTFDVRTVNSLNNATKSVRDLMFPNKQENNTP